MARSTSTRNAFCYTVLLAASILIVCSKTAFPGSSIDSYVSEVDGSPQPYGCDLLISHPNDPNPEDIVLKTNELKYGSAYRVRIDRLELSGEFATIEATIADQAVQVTAAHLLQYTLFLTPQLVATNVVLGPLGGLHDRSLARDCGVRPRRHRGQRSRQNLDG